MGDRSKLRSNVACRMPPANTIEYEASKAAKVMNKAKTSRTSKGLTLSDKLAYFELFQAHRRRLSVYQRSLALFRSVSHRPTNLLATRSSQR